MKIVSTKLNPKDILPILGIIDNYGDINKRKENIHEYLKKVSDTGSISERNAVYALAFPTLRRLNLIVGKGKELHLDLDGKLLLRTCKKKGEEEYMRLLAKIILRTDNEKSRVIDMLLKSNKSSLTKDEIVKELTENGIETSVNDDRLSKWLRILKYVGLIGEMENRFFINRSQIKALKRDVNVSIDFFNKTLVDSYEKLVKERRGNLYVPIPLLEREVCNRLSEKGFTTFDFRKRLTSIIGKKVSGYSLLLSKPGAREPNGLRIDDQYYYYIAMFKD